MTSSSQSTSSVVDVSLVFPCYCEEGHLERNIGRVIETAKTTPWRYEIILVEDKSPDQTADVVRKLVAAHPDLIRAVFHERNRGRGAAVMSGVADAKAPVVGFFDIDLEVGPSYMIPCIEAVRDGGKLVVGARHYAAMKTPMRTILSRSYRMLAYAALGIPMPVDSESGYKFFDRDALNRLATSIEHPGWFWDTEVVYRFFAAGYDVRAVPCEFVRDPTKRSTVRVVRDSIDYAKALHEFARKHGRLRLDKRPN